MITGRRPFHGDTSAELISSIMRDTPDPVSDLKPWHARTSRTDHPALLDERSERSLSDSARCIQRIARLEHNQRAIRTAGLQFPVRRNVDRSASVPASGRRSGDGKFFRWPRSRYYRRVVSILLSVRDFRDSTLRLKGQSYDVRAASAQLGARYIIQGGIRKSGSLIRVNVQLMDAQTGTNLWAETYNRDLKNSDIFTIQDEITDRVAATLADNFGVLVRSMVASLEDKPDDQLSANEFVFRFFGYWTKLTPEEHAKIRTTLEHAVEKIPRNADIWACLSIVYYHEFAFGSNELPNSLDRCLAAAQRAVELNRASQIAYEALTWAHFLRRDLRPFPQRLIVPYL